MKDKELDRITKAYRKIPESIASDKLGRLAMTLFGTRWMAVDGYSSMTDISNVMNPKTGIDVYIGRDWLFDECSPGQVNLVGCIITVQQMYHEKRHIQHYTNEWNKRFVNRLASENDVITDIVRRNFIRDFFVSAYTHNYENDPGEIDAEIYGIEKTIEYFQTNALFSRIVAQDEVKSILYDVMMSDSYGHKEQLKGYRTDSPDEMLESFRNFRNTAVHTPYPITLDRPPLISMTAIKPSQHDMTKQFLNQDRYASYKAELKNCDDGRLMDKFLEQVVLMGHPDAIRYAPRLQNELKACRRQMDVRKVFIGNSFTPMSKVCWSNGTFSSEDEFADFSDAVARISNNPTGLQL